MTSSSHTLKFSVAWGKEKYSAELDPADGLDGLQASLFSLTNVPAERQKIIISGKLIKESADVTKFLKEGSKVMLTGSADALPKEPTKKIVFEEDLTESEKMKIGSTLYASAGLQNLGNTCYLNSTLQSLRFVGPLKDGLLQYMNRAGSVPSDADPNHSLISQLGLLFRNMDQTTQPITPLLFTSTFRSLFPQFAEKDDEGHWRQQDADECFNTIITSMADKLSQRVIQIPTVPGYAPPSSSSSSSASSSTASASTSTSTAPSPASSSLVSLAQPCGSAPLRQPSNLIDFLFSFDVESVWKCSESADEDVKTTYEPSRKLRCPIELTTSYLHEGIEKDFNDQIERRSEKLGRNAIWDRKSTILRLPPFLVVQFVRFLWKNKEQKKAKICRKVEFPMKFDASPFTAKKLKASLLAARRIQKDENDAKLGVSPLDVAKKREKEALEKKQKESELKVKEKGSEKDKEKLEKELKEKEKEKEAKEAKEKEEEKDVEYVASAGYYELFAVITHRGRYADSGHYVGWVRAQSGSDKWLLFDDDKVSSVTGEDIKQLNGASADWHMAYICLYRRIDDMVGQQERFKRIANGLGPYTPEEIAAIQKAAGHEPSAAVAAAASSSSASTSSSASK